MKRPVGFFDSGLGGLSVLAEAVRQLPRENFLYLGDSAHSPYGTKSDQEVRSLTLSAVDSLVSQGIKALVVACNTATGAAIEALRAKYAFPVIGLEPALKTAEDSHRGGLVLVMATPLTLQSAKYRALHLKYGAHAAMLPCPGLMEFVEREELSGADLDGYLDHLFKPFLDTAIDSVVLGCTHYPFLRKAISKHLPETVRIIDSSGGVVRQLARKLDEFSLRNTDEVQGKIELRTTGDAAKAAQMRRMFKLAQES